MLVRIPGARHSQDVDLLHPGTDIIGAVDELRALSVRPDLDRFTFEIEAKGSLTGVSRGAQLKATVYLGTTRVGNFPIDIAIEKLRGFVTDQEAKIISIRDNRVEIEISSDRIGSNRRKADRPSSYRLELEFSEERLEKTNSFGLAAGSYAQTMIHASIRPKKSRNRRREDQMERARMAIQSLKAYLMAREVEADGPRVASIGSR